MNDRRSERNLCNCVKKPEKKDFNGVWTRDLTIPVRCSTNWAMKPLTLGAGQLWVHMFPWRKWVLMIYQINHIWTAETKWKWRNYRRSERNLCNCVKKPHFCLNSRFNSYCNTLYINAVLLTWLGLCLAVLLLSKTATVAKDFRLKIEFVFSFHITLFIFLLYSFVFNGCKNHI